MQILPRGARLEETSPRKDRTPRQAKFHEFYFSHTQLNALRVAYAQEQYGIAKTTHIGADDSGAATAAAAVDGDVAQRHVL